MGKQTEPLRSRMLYYIALCQALFSTYCTHVTISKKKRKNETCPSDRAWKVRVTHPNMVVRANRVVQQFTAHLCAVKIDSSPLLKSYESWMTLSVEPLRAHTVNAVKELLNIVNYHLPVHGSEAHDAVLFKLQRVCADVILPKYVEALYESRKVAESGKRHLLTDGHSLLDQLTKRCAVEELSDLLSLLENFAQARVQECQDVARKFETVVQCCRDQHVRLNSWLKELQIANCQNESQASVEAQNSVDNTWGCLFWSGAAATAAAGVTIVTAGFTAPITVPIGLAFCGGTVGGGFSVGAAVGTGLDARNADRRSKSYQEAATRGRITIRCMADMGQSFHIAVGNVRKMQDFWQSQQTALAEVKANVGNLPRREHNTYVYISPAVAHTVKVRLDQVAAVLTAYIDGMTLLADDLERLTVG